MKASIRLLALAGLIGTVTVPEALAQALTATIGGASFNYPATSHFDATQTANFTGAGTGDYVFEAGWWFRVAGDTQESFFPAPNTAVSNGASFTATWTDVNTRGLFGASEVATISSATANTATVKHDLTITNTSAVNPLTIEIFHGVDFDVNGSAGTDNATLPNGGVEYIRITDTTAGFAEYYAPGALAFMVRPFAATTDVFGLLADTTVTNFDNSGLPATNFDFTGGFQWHLVIPAGGSATVTAYLTGNVAAPVGPGATAPVFSYNPAAGSTVNFTGGAGVGSTATASIDVAVATAGSGTGVAATTTTTCSVPSGFSGFAQSVTAVGNAATTSGGPLTGSCTVAAAAATAVMTCTENQGGSNVSRTFTLSCPAAPAGPSADLAITKTDGVTSATPGGSVTYTISASNAGPSTATGATVADTFPATKTCSWTCVGAGGGTCTASGSGNINDTVNLPSGGSVTYTAACTISAGATGTLVNTATVTAPAGVTDPNPANNSATDTDTLGASADLSITKTDGVTTATPGGSVTYTISASNAGPSNAAGATVADTFPATQTCTWTCVGAGGGTCTASGSGNISDTINLPATGSVTYTASCAISAAASGSVVNTATVAAPAGVTDPNPANNSATDTDTLSQGVLGVLSASVSFGAQSVGSTSTRTLTLTNTGAAPLQVTSITAALPPFAQVTGGTCPAAVPFTINANSSCTVLYTFNPTTAGSFSQVLTIVSNAGTVTATLLGVGGVAIPLPLGGASSLGLLLLLAATALVLLRKRD